MVQSEVPEVHGYSWLVRSESEGMSRSLEVSKCLPQPQGQDPGQERDAQVQSAELSVLDEGSLLLNIPGLMGV